jgi:methyl-accepting chemotaxis protein
MNAPPPIPSRDAFFNRLIGLHSWMSVPALAIVLGCVHVFLQLTADQWKVLGGVTLVYGIIAFPVTRAIQRRMMQPILVWLDGTGAAPPAFEATMSLGLRAGVIGGVSWVIPVVIVSGVMDVAFATWGWHESAVLLLAGIASGFVVGSLLGFLVKPRIVDVLEAVASEIPDPNERARYGTRIPLRRKLMPTLCGVTLLPVVFAALLAIGHADDSNEKLANDWQARLLAEFSAAPTPTSLREVESELARLPLLAPLRLATLDALVTDGSVEPSIASAVRAEAADGAAEGSSRRLSSDSVFAWRSFGGEIWVAVSPGDTIWKDRASSLLLFGVLSLVSAILALMISHYASEDVSHATDRLRGEVERFASGDLRPGRIWESEDELGDLARSFERMAGSLRQTLRRVAEAADRVEQSSVALSPVSEGVATVSAAQVESMEQAAGSMEEIDAQVRGIANSSTSLNEAVEESSSSVLELGAAGHQLNETAVSLHESVEEVSTSIEQLTRSVSQVTSTTESLSEAAEETSASMEEMASSLREVDASALETSRLSEEVVGRAESGQEKVRETIEGMERIQEATETAEQVIRGLHGRTVEIGAIVDVIDDVADETNLLALNAAIIAAQAGEQGRAFSVVADEIKDLAERVLASTKEIGGLISAVQTEATKATSAIEEGTASVANGVERSAEAGMALEAITKASRESGTRMAGIVNAVQAQSQAAVHVVELMEKVRDGVGQIREASVEQNRGHNVLSQSSVTMRNVAQQVRGTTEEQARGASRIRDSIEGVRVVVEQINGALHEQSQATASALSELEAVQTRTAKNEESALTLDEVTKVLQKHAEMLRDEVGRFQL